MLFGKKKKAVKPAPSPKPQTKMLWSHTYPQSSTFRGYRRVKMSTYPKDEVFATIDELKRQKYRLKDRTIRLDHVESDEYKVVNVYIDNMLIGSVFNNNEEAYSMLTDYDIDKAHIRIEDSAPDEFYEYVVTAKAFLFVHYPNEAPIKITTTVE